jgi:hypothetical protein
MAEELDDRSKDLVVDVLLLALSRCTKGGVGLSLRPLLRHKREIFARDDGAIDLEAAREVLGSQQGIDLETTKPALRFVKSLERRFGSSIRLPSGVELVESAPPEAPLVQVDELDRFFVAASARPPTPDGARSLPGIARRLTPIPTAASSSPRRMPTPVPGTPRTVPPRERTPPPDREKSTTKGKTLAPSALHETNVSPAKLAVAVGSLVAAFLCVWFIARPAIVGGKSWKDVAPAEVSTEIPVASAKVIGRELHLELSDQHWLRLPEDTRVQQLKRTLQAAHQKDYQTVVVKDTSKKIRASAQWLGSPPEPRIRFY